MTDAPPAAAQKYRCRRCDGTGNEPAVDDDPLAKARQDMDDHNRYFEMLTSHVKNILPNMAERHIIDVLDALWLIQEIGFGNEVLDALSLAQDSCWGIVTESDENGMFLNYVVTEHDVVKGSGETIVDAVLAARRGTKRNTSDDRLDHPRLRPVRLRRLPPPARQRDRSVQVERPRARHGEHGEVLQIPVVQRGDRDTRAILSRRCVARLNRGNRRDEG